MYYFISSVVFSSWQITTIVQSKNARSLQYQQQKHSILKHWGIGIPSNIQYWDCCRSEATFSLLPVLVGVSSRPLVSYLDNFTTYELPQVIKLPSWEIPVLGIWEISQCPLCDYAKLMGVNCLESLFMPVLNIQFPYKLFVQP